MSQSAWGDSVNEIADRLVMLGIPEEAVKPVRAWVREERALADQAQSDDRDDDSATQDEHDQQQVPHDP